MYIYIIEIYLIERHGHGFLCLLTQEFHSEIWDGLISSSHILFFAKNIEIKLIKNKTNYDLSIIIKRLVPYLLWLQPGFAVMIFYISLKKY